MQEESKSEAGAYIDGRREVMPGIYVYAYVKMFIIN